MKVARATDGRVLFEPLPQFRETLTDRADEGNASCWTLFGGEPAICCPQCFQWSLLENRVKGTKHAVDAAGNVHPSVVHAVTGCTFHEWVRLVGWRGPPPSVAEEVAAEREKHGGGPRVVP